MAGRRRRFREVKVMQIFETSRLLFRHLVPDDFDDLYRLYRDIEIRRYFPDGVRTAEETKEELEWFLDGHPRDRRLGLWATIEKSSNRFIGRCGLLPWEIDGVMEVEIAYMIDKSRWREGFGSEAANGLVEYAFSELRLPKVIALIDPEHEASIRTAKNAGLSFEKEVWMDGVLSAVYSLLKKA
jgi:RimJ/RimL family protein N-acetyltransferase